MCLLAMMMVSNSFPKSSYWGAAQPSNLLATAAFSHPNWAGYLVGSYQSDHNTLSSTFEWTNDSRSLTSAAQFLTTNSSRP